MGSYSWGSAALAWLYRHMYRVANKNVTNLAGPLQLLQTSFKWAAYLPTNDGNEKILIQYRLALDRLGGRDIVWEPYTALDVLAVLHPEILAEEHD
ncbi:uncharacterized protein DS421_14g460450 [Arachis hypogaea]|nr:uncharacterized protein DS421_14g460450 [Arachis hypogaea]